MSVGPPPVPPYVFDTTVGQDHFDAVGPLTWADSGLGWPLAIYLDAVGLILEEIAVLVREDDAGNGGWSAFTDPYRCPVDFLFTLAQWSGVSYPRRMSEAALRDLIGPHAPGLWRGTRDAILAGVRRYLTDVGILYFEERADGDAYHIRIFTYNFDTADEAAIRHELYNLIPAGLIVDYEVRQGQTYAMNLEKHATYADVKAAYVDYAAMVADTPTD